MSLEAYRSGRLAEARGAAERLVAEATSAAAAEVAEASRTVAAALVEARANGTGQADREMSVRRVIEQRRSHRIILAARRRAYEGLRAEASVAVRDLQLEPGYPALLERLAQLAREQLGDGAHVEQDPAGGGIAAEVDGRRVDYSLNALVDRCLRGLGAEVENLWR